MEPLLVSDQYHTAEPGILLRAPERFLIPCLTPIIPGFCPIKREQFKKGSLLDITVFKIGSDAKGGKAHELPTGNQTL